MGSRVELHPQAADVGAQALAAVVGGAVGQAVDSVAARPEEVAVGVDRRGGSRGVDPRPPEPARSLGSTEVGVRYWSPARPVRRSSSVHPRPPGPKTLLGSTVTGLLLLIPFALRRRGW